MSYILEALRKAERERKLGNVPSIDATLDSVNAPANRSRWPTIVAAGLVTNAVLLGALYLYWQHGTEAVVERPRSQASLEEAPRTPTSESLPAPAVEARDFASPARSNPESRMTASPTAPAIESAPTASGLETASLIRKDTGNPTAVQVVPDQPETPPPALEEPAPDAAAPEPQPTRVARVEPPLPPLLDDLPADFRSRVPRLDLTVHVYSDTPSQRFIFVNNRRYGEGQDTEEGARVERIQPNGIVLSFQGQEFFLPGRW